MSQAAALPILRAGFEGSGSPRWLMRTMQRHGFDRAHGFALDLVLLAEGRHSHGTLQALADRHVDVVDADRQALAAAQAAGLPITAVAPYGRILGSLVLHRDYAGKLAHGLGALRFSRLGVLSVSDKNWRLLEAACRAEADFDLASAVRVVHYPRRSELVSALAAGAIDAALVHWHLVPQLAAAGHRVLAELPDLADALANSAASSTARPAAPHDYPAAPTTFFVMHQACVDRSPELVASFVAATAQAVAALQTDEPSWHALAAEDALGATDPRHLTELRARWQARVGVFHTAPSTQTELRSTR